VQKAALPFADKRDFEEAKRGFIAAPKYKQIMAEAGHVTWDMGFEILPGTGVKDLTSAKDAFAVEPLAINAMTD
jgi:alkyl sulfatase BDS1-like metallo-beta-lactamase superfamily hydrolase